MTVIIPEITQRSHRVITNIAVAGITHTQDSAKLRAVTTIHVCVLCLYCYLLNQRTLYFLLATFFS